MWSLEMAHFKFGLFKWHELAYKYKYKFCLNNCHGQTKQAIENLQLFGESWKCLLSSDSCTFSVAPLVCSWRSKEKVKKLPQIRFQNLTEGFKILVNPSLTRIFEKNQQFLYLFFLLPRANQISYRTFKTIWKKKTFPAFSR